MQPKGVRADSGKMVNMKQLKGIEMQTIEGRVRGTQQGIGERREGR